MDDKCGLCCNVVPLLQGCVVVAISCHLRTRSSASLTSLVIDTGSTETARTLPQPSVRRFVRTPIHACGSCGAPGAMQHCATLTVHGHKGTRNARGSLAAASRRGTSPAHSAQMGEQPTQRRARHAQRKPRRPHAHGSPHSRACMHAPRARHNAFVFEASEELPKCPMAAAGACTSHIASRIVDCS